MNKIRKPGEHPGKARIPGIRPISTKEIRNKRRLEKLMSDTPSFISEKLQKIEEEYSNATDLATVLHALNRISLQNAQGFVDKANETESDVEKVNLLHRCIIALLKILEDAENKLHLVTLKYQHEVELLNSMAAELSLGVEKTSVEIEGKTEVDEDEANSTEEPAEETVEEATE